MTGLGLLTRSTSFALTFEIQDPKSKTMVDLTLLALLSLVIGALASLLSSRVRKHVVGSLPRRPSVLLEKGPKESTPDKFEEEERVPGGTYSPSPFAF